MSVSISHISLQKSKFIGIAVLLAFVMIAVFGLYVPVHTGHDTGCPLAPHGSVVCQVPLAHIQHWQTALAVVLGELFECIAVAIVFYIWTKPFANRSPQYERYRHELRVPKKPTRLQELFSQGILHRKEPPTWASIRLFAQTF